MSFLTHPRKLPLFFYLSVSYLLVYAVCALLLYLINVRVISRSARAFDRQDVESASREYTEILHNNRSGDWLAEEVALENFPASTYFAIRVLNPDGHIAYSASQPTHLAIPGGWETGLCASAQSLSKTGWSEVSLPASARHLQVKTTKLEDGRTLQVAKSTNREKAQRHTLSHTSLIFFLLASLFSIANGFWMMAITLRPIKQVSSEMAHIIKTGAFDLSVSTVNSRIAELNTLGEFFNLMIRRNAKLIEAMRDTLDNLAHDFRTPLTRIRGAAEVSLNAHANTPENEALLGTLADIIDDCDNARLQLQNLMDIREMESGCVELETRPLEVKRMIAEIADLYAVLAEDKDIALSLDLPEGDVRIEGDYNRLSQVLANLVDNAVKYTPRGGQVKIALEAAADHIRVTVTDTGIGIPEEEHALIWQRLYRSRNARNEKGLGLGMSIIKAIVDAHGGSVTFTSAPSQGSAFVVTLPIRTPSSAAPRQVA